MNRQLRAGAATFRLVSWAAGVRLDATRDDALLLTSRWGRDRVARPSTAVREVLRRMVLGPVLPANAGIDAADAARVVSVLDGLSHLVVHTLGVDDLGGPLLSAFPKGRPVPFPLAPLPPEQAVRLRRRTVSTVRSRGIVLDHPDARRRVELHRAEAGLVASLLAWPVGAREAAGILALPSAVVTAVVEYLAASDLVVPAS
ncbi:MAG: NADH oxidase [Streptomycetaceae bacterium]|nr:NADH oxidase [Streptomycetaceae bacterium]